jgi:hypothetical protein
MKDFRVRAIPHVFCSVAPQTPKTAAKQIIDIIKQMTPLLSYLNESK